MPEGHTLHRLARDHDRWFAGTRPAVSSPQGRFAGATLVDGTELGAVSAHGKHLLYDYAAGRTVHVHLGLFGHFDDHAVPPPEPKDTVRMRLVAGDHTVDLVGATTCEVLDPADRAALLDRLGPDPLRPEAGPGPAFEALQRRRVGIGRALLDQAVLAGVGNVYRAEVLFVHGLHPRVPAASLGRDRWASIWGTLRRWMRRGVRQRRIVTVDPAELPAVDAGGAGRRRTYVYKRDTCLRCGSGIRRFDLAGRWAYACETCQPPPDGAGAGAAR